MRSGVEHQQQSGRRNLNRPTDRLEPRSNMPAEVNHDDRARGSGQRSLQVLERPGLDQSNRPRGEPGFELPRPGSNPFVRDQQRAWQEIWNSVA